MSMLFAFFSNAHLNKRFPLASLSNALIQEIKGTFENSVVILNSPHLRTNFSSVLKKVLHYTKGSKYVFVLFRD